MSESSQGEICRQPLSGRRILVTRSAAQAPALADPLQRLGAEVFLCPTIAIVPAEDLTGLDQALGRLAEVDYLVLTSPNAVEFFFARLRERGLAPKLLATKTIVAVGPKTATAIAGQGLQVDLVPEDFRAEGLVDLLGPRVNGRCVLYPKAGLARDLLPQRLTEAGARVWDPIVYTSVVPPEAAASLAEAVRTGLDLLTFTASSTVRNLAKLLAGENEVRVRQVPAASIGPLTTITARELGFQVAVEPPEATLESLIAAIRTYFEKENSRP